jgi:hypothetical protein
MAVVKPSLIIYRQDSVAQGRNIYIAKISYRNTYIHY